LWIVQLSLGLLFLVAGSARVVADLIGGRDAGVDLDGLGVERLLGR